MELFLEGLGFGESPRWRDGRLWFSDFGYRHVASADLDGAVRIEAWLDAWPSGLGWLPDGRLLIVSMQTRQVLRREPDGTLVIHADLSTIAGGDTNDMVVAQNGTAYVGNVGFDWATKEPPRPATLAVVCANGTVSSGPDRLVDPNGSVITPDGDTLIVGESNGHRYRAFPIAPDGTLGEGWLWADLEGRHPDGCTLDAEGAIWFADPTNGGSIVRVREGGEITEFIEPPETPYACMLGGDDGHTLFVLTSSSRPSRTLSLGAAKVWSMQVAVPHAGLP